MANEAFRVSSVGGLQNLRPLDLEAFGATEMDRRRGVEANAGVAVLLVVPPEETPAELAGMFDRAETVWELRSILEGLV